MMKNNDQRKDVNVFISADMEGITGITTPADVVRGEREYERGTDLLHGDVNAAVEGAFDGGASEVVVNDSHSGMRNLDRSRLDDRASLIRGSTKPRSMMQGLTPEHDVALFVGYHAKAGTPGAVLNHTFYGHELLRLSVNGREVGELGWNAGLVAHLDVPVGLVTGDDKTISEASDELGDGVETAAVKTGIDRFSAECLSPEKSQTVIREAATRALEHADSGDFDQPMCETPVTIEAEWSATNHAHRASGLPNVERTGGRTTSVNADTYGEAFDASVAMLRAGGAGRNEFYG
jgi:D-amino peptidase